MTTALRFFAPWLRRLFLISETTVHSSLPNPRHERQPAKDSSRTPVQTALPRLKVRGPVIRMRCGAESELAAHSQQSPLSHDLLQSFR